MTGTIQTASVYPVLGEMVDSDLREWFEQAKADLAEAASAEPNSEWHQSCFAAVVVIADEMERRGLKTYTVH